MVCANKIDLTRQNSMTCFVLNIERCASEVSDEIICGLKLNEPHRERVHARLSLDIHVTTKILSITI